MAFEDLQTEHPWWAMATGPPRPRSATGCLPRPSAVHRRPPKRSRTGALHTSLPAFQVMVVMVMVVIGYSDNYAIMQYQFSVRVFKKNSPSWRKRNVMRYKLLDNRKCDISLTSIHLSVYEKIQSIVAWKPPLLPLTSSHQKSLVLSPSSCSCWECFGESNGKRLTRHLGDLRWPPIEILQANCMTNI